jgi:RHS repeat-associated protein
MAIDSTSNRLAHEAYDVAGNVLTNTPASTQYHYDAAGMLALIEPQFSVSRRMIYTADDERIGTLIDSAGEWTIRGFDKKVLTRFRSSTNDWVWEQDYVYANGQLVGGDRELAHGGRRHHHLDHLGSVRMTSSDSRTRYAINDYYPFGIEQTSLTQEDTNFGYGRPETMKFTGHERDFVGGWNDSSSDYLDYMHARYYNPNWGRFLSVDPVLNIEAAVQNPQRWNRYSYVSNNPINKIDPDGREENFYMEKLFREQQMVGDGTMTEEEYWERRHGEGIGGLTGASMVGGGLLLRGGWRAATVFAMRNPGVVLMGMKVLDTFGGNVSSRLNSTGLTGGKHGYLLDNATKSGFFRGVMGLTEKTIGGALRSHFAENFAKNSRFNQRGFLEVTGRMVDSKGRAWSVTTTWQWNQKTKVWDLITADNFRQVK